MWVEMLPKLAFAAILAARLGAVPDRTPGHAFPVLQGIKAVPAPDPSPAQVPVALPAVASSADRLTAAQVASFARQAGFPESAVPTMVAYADRESGYCPRAVNGQGCVGMAYAGGPACGLWQLYPCPGPSALDPMVNAWGARQKCLASVAAGRGCFAPWGG